MHSIVLKNSGLLVLFISLVFTACFSYEEVTIEKVDHIKIKSFTTKGIELIVALKINNPNKYAISLVDSDLELFIDGNKIGDASIEEKIKLPKKSNEVHKFTVVTTYKGILTSALPTIVAALTGKSIELGVKGSIKAKAKSISKKFPVEATERVRLN